MKNWKNEAYEQLQSISELKNNWNDNGANKFKLTLINHAKQIINNFPIEFELQLFPTARDSIQFEYETDNLYLEFELFEDHSSIYFSNHENTILNLSKIDTLLALNLFISIIAYDNKEEIKCLKI